MLTHITIKNFKGLEEASFELGQSVVLVGPNDSGKTTALQALALWQFGLNQLLAKKGKGSPKKRTGTTINRLELIALPIPAANLLWHGLRTKSTEKHDGKQKTENVRIDIIVQGFSKGKPWQCGLEFGYTNAETFYCLPLRVSHGKQPERMDIPDAAKEVKISFLPNMSGLVATEPKLESGRIDVLIGEGQTAQVLRNLCHQVYESTEHWHDLKDRIQKMFGVEILPPEYIHDRGEITMSYKDRDRIKLDISAAGRGFQQILLLLAHLYANPSTVLLLDEPDAHLEILRQREIYQVLTDLAATQNAQIIAASHSEVILNEAGDKDTVIAFLGKPHRIDNRAQVKKSLNTIRQEDYYQAEQRGWVLYLEGSTDLAILQEFAALLEHPVAEHLARPFVKTVGNLPNDASEHFWGLHEAKSDLIGVALFDHLHQGLPDSFKNNSNIIGLQWHRCEIENYFCTQEVLLQYAANEGGGDLFSVNSENIMRECIDEMVASLKTQRKPNPWSPDIKITDDFLDPLFENYFERLGLPNKMRKAKYHILARLATPESLDSEVVEKLDAILAVAEQASKPEE